MTQNISKTTYSPSVSYPVAPAPVSKWQRFVNVISNIWNRLFGCCFSSRSSKANEVLEQRTRQYSYLLPDQGNVDTPSDSDIEEEDDYSKEDAYQPQQGTAPEFESLPAQVLPTSRRERAQANAASVMPLPDLSVLTATQTTTTNVAAQAGIRRPIGAFAGPQDRLVAAISDVTRETHVTTVMAVDSKRHAKLHTVASNVAQTYAVPNDMAVTVDPDNPFKAPSYTRVRTTGVTTVETRGTVDIGAHIRRQRDKILGQKDQ